MERAGPSSTQTVTDRNASRRGRWGGAAGAVLQHPRMPWVAAALAVVLTLPSVGSGLMGDDYHHKLVMKDSHSPVRLVGSRWDLFRFFDGDPAHCRELMEHGVLPWWTCGGIGVKAAFWRPVASFTHWADYLLWPERPALMHVQSVLWYAAVVAVTALLYRRLMGAGLAAGLAAVLYAVDHTHALPVAFLANRSDLPAVLFGVLCILAHDRWRREGWRGGAVLGPVLLVLSLLSKEAGIATCAYLAAYEAFLGPGLWTERLRTLVPYLLVVIAWRACWTYLGYGVSEMGLYIDPVTEPLRYLAAVPGRTLVLLLGLLGVPPAEAFHLLANRHRWWLLLGATLFLLAVAVLFLPLLRRDRMARCWAGGMVLSILPACATFASGRLLMFAGIGAMGLLAQWLSATRLGKVNFSVLPRWFARGMAGFLVGVHLVISPLLLAAVTAFPGGTQRMRDQILLSRPMDPEIRGQTLVVVNPPEVAGMLISLLTWAAEDAPIPRHLRGLVSSSFRPVEVYRADERTLVVRPAAGFLAGILDTLFRAPWRPLRVGDEVVLEGMRVRITGVTADGRPAEAAFVFGVPLEDASLRWMCWEDGEFMAFVPPAVGERVVVGE